jgi:hypothetical protein
MFWLSLKQPQYRKNKLTTAEIDSVNTATFITSCSAGTTEITLFYLDKLLTPALRVFTNGETRLYLLLSAGTRVLIAANNFRDMKDKHMAAISLLRSPMTGCHGGQEPNGLA